MDYELQQGSGAKVTAENILRVMNERGGWLSRAQIAKELGVSKSPTLNVVLENLVAGGYLRRARSYMPNGAVKFSYTADIQRWGEQ